MTKTIEEYELSTQDQESYEEFTSFYEQSEKNEKSSNATILTKGKIVKVNNDGTGKPAYFSWNQITMNWDTETFGIDSSELVNRQELQIVNADLQAFKENVEASNESISQRLDTIDENVTNINQDIDDMEQQLVQLESNVVEWNELK